jgi:hypothetical protein
MKFAFSPKSRACLMELFQRGCVACQARFDGLQVEVSSASRLTIAQRRQRIRQIGLSPTEQNSHLDNILDVGQGDKPLFDLALRVS